MLALPTKRLKEPCTIEELAVKQNLTSCFRETACGITENEAEVRWNELKLKIPPMMELERILIEEQLQVESHPSVCWLARIIAYSQNTRKLAEMVRRESQRQAREDGQDKIGFKGDLETEAHTARVVGFCKERQELRQAEEQSHRA